MDHLVSAGSVELVRDLYESSQAAILLIGEEMLPTKLKKYERFHGRVLSWVPAQPVTLLDAQKLVQVYSPQVVIADDLLGLLVEKSHGSVRRVAVNLENVRDTSLDLGLDRMDLATWGDRPLYTGEAPNRRNPK